LNPLLYAKLKGTLKNRYFQQSRDFNLLIIQIFRHAVDENRIFQSTLNKYTKEKQAKLDGATDQPSPDRQIRQSTAFA